MTLKDISVRAAHGSDADEIIPIAAEFARSFVPKRPAFEVALRRILAREDSCLLVAEVEGRVIGYVLGFDHRTFFANGPVS